MHTAVTKLRHWFTIQRDGVLWTIILAALSDGNLFNLESLRRCWTTTRSCCVKAGSHLNSKPST